METATASPFASSLLFDYVATYMYEGDTPNAERRAAALSLDRDLLRELLGQEELRDLIDPGALARRRGRSAVALRAPHGATRDALHDMLRELGDLSATEVAARVLAGVDAESMLAALAGERRAVPRARRRRGALDRRRRRRPLPRRARRRPAGRSAGGLPRGRARRAAARRPPLRRDPRAVHDRRASARATASTARPCSARSNATASSSAASCGRAAPSASGATRRSCAGCAAPRWRCCARRSSRSISARSPASFPAGRASIATRPPGRASTACATCSSRSRALALAPRSGSARCCRAGSAPTRPPGSTSSAPPARSSGSAPARSGASGRVALYFRDDLTLLGAAGRQAGGASPRDRRTSLVTGAAGARRLLLLRPARRDHRRLDRGAPGGALGSRLGGRGDQRRVRAAARAAAVARPRDGRSEPGGRAPGASRRARATPRGPASARIQGRWSLTAPLLGAGTDPAARRRALAELLLERYGVLTREQVLAEGIAGGFSAIYSELTQLETLGIARRGYFVEGLGGAQFALPGAVERLREQRTAARTAPLVLSAVDPAQPYGAALAVAGAGPEGRAPARAGRGARRALSAVEPIALSGAQRARAGDARRRPRIRASAVAGGARRVRPLRPDQAARAREGRRRAGARLAGRGRR